MTLHFRAESLTHVRGANHSLIRRLRLVIRFARQIRDVHETGGDFVPAPGPAHAVFKNRGERATVERPQVLLFRKRAKPARIFRDDRVVHRHFFVKFNTHLENFPEVFFKVIHQFVHFAIAD